MKTKFLIQTCNGKIIHDFSFTLLQSIEFQNWINPNDKIKYKFFDTIILSDNTIDSFIFKNIDKTYIPVGSVEFVTMYFQQFYNHTPTPLNVPKELMNFLYSNRKIFNGNHMDLENLTGKWFIKSNSKIKGLADVFKFDGHHYWNIPADNYQFSEYINIDSEWRAFIYNKKLVGLQNYVGEFTKFPNVDIIKLMIGTYKSAPIAYTLDVGVNDYSTFVIEVHDFFSCGLYGFADHSKYPFMLSKWFYEYINKIK